MVPRSLGTLQAALGVRQTSEQSSEKIAQEEGERRVALGFFLGGFGRPAVMAGHGYQFQMVISMGLYIL